MIGKKIVLMNAKRERCDSSSPHLGLAMLAGVLGQKGHKVLVADYQFEKRCPPPQVLVKRFQPDVIGVSLYTATMKEADKILNSVADFEIPVMVGGPHASLYSDDLILDKRIKVIVRGEAEEIIGKVVDNIDDETFTSQNRIVRGKLPDPKDLPFPDFRAFFSWDNISVYPLLTSRGCPYNCSFCAVHMISSKKWRERKPGVCIEELTRAKVALPNLDSVIVYDDSPMTKKEHIKQFLNAYLARGVDLPLTIINTRADCLDEEILSLLKRVRCPSIALGVEHGNPEVFGKIGKSETLQDIIRSSILVKKYKIPLSLCFIIGLQNDSLERTRESVSLAKNLRPAHIYWNMATPFKGTRLREWYDQHGRVYDVINHSSWVDGDYMCDEPCAESSEFGLEERKRAYLMAILETVDTRLKIWHIPRLIPQVKGYRLYKEFLTWFPRRIVRDAVSLIFLPLKAMAIYKNDGLRGIRRRLERYVKAKTSCQSF